MTTNNTDCLFCGIASHKIPGEIVFENDVMVAFKDIYPKAPIHILIVPKKHITSIATHTKEDATLIGEMIYRLKLLAEEKGVAKKGYKIVINTGKEGGQVIDHIHIHLLAGKKFSE